MSRKETASNIDSSITIQDYQIDAVVRIALKLSPASLSNWNLNHTQVEAWQQTLAQGQLPQEFSEITHFEDHIRSKCRFSYNRRAKTEARKGNVVWYGGRYLFTEEVEQINKSNQDNH